MHSDTTQLQHIVKSAFWRPNKQLGNYLLGTIRDLVSIQSRYFEIGIYWRGLNLNIAGAS